MLNFNQINTKIHYSTECYNSIGDPNDENPLDINIPQFEGIHAVEGFGIYNDYSLNPLKLNKVNIGSTNTPMFPNIGDYLDDKIVGNITALLYEIHDLFATIFYK